MVPFPRPTKLFRFFPCVCKCGERKCGASTSNTNEYWHSIQNKREFKQTTQKETKNNLINYLIFVPCPSTVASSLWPRKKQFTIPFKNTDLPSQPRRNDSAPLLKHDSTTIMCQRQQRMTSKNTSQSGLYRTLADTSWRSNFTTFSFFAPQGDDARKFSAVGGLQEKKKRNKR